MKVPFCRSFPARLERLGKLKYMRTTAELFALAERLHRSGNLAGAEPLYRQVLQADPLHSRALHLLGLLSHQTGRRQSGNGLFRQAIQIDPTVADYHFNFGIALAGQNEFAEAAECFRQALKINPNDAFGHYNLANAFYKQGQFEEAAAGFRQTLSLNPNMALAHSSLGLVLFWQGELESAIECYRQTVWLDPKNPEAHVDLGSALLWQGQLADAGECFRRALDLEPGHKKGLWNRSLLRLLQGDLEGGWPDYELRPALTGTACPFQQPRWDGASLEGKTILVYAEQGLGDTIQFGRYLPLVQGRGGRVIFACQPSLEALGFPGVDQLVTAGLPAPPFDVQIPLLSLPLVFGTTLATIPADVPYLQANPQRVLRWRQELANAPAAGDSGLNIGVAWQGSLNQQTQKGDRRSLPLSHFESLARMPGVRLFSLLVGPGTKELAAAAFPITDLGCRFDPNSLEDLAAALVNMDLVVTVDSAVAHLAGALGVPVWTLLPFAADWRWLLDREDSPWYPTMRLFRQKRLGDWGEVIQRVAERVSPGDPFLPGQRLRQQQ